MRKPFSEAVLIIGGGGILMLALGIAPSLWLGHPAASFASARDVGVASGQITSVDTGQASRGRRRGFRPENRSWCEVVMPYSVAGESYEFVDTRRFLSRSQAEDCVEANAVGRRRRIYFLRSQPAVAYTDPERFGNWPFLAGMLLLTPFGAALVFLAWRIHRGLQPAT